MGITDGVKKIGDFEINMLPPGKFLSTGLVNVIFINII